MVKIFCTQMHTNFFSVQYGVRGRFLKLILTYLKWTKSNENKICYSDVQKHVSDTGLGNGFL